MSRNIGIIDIDRAGYDVEAESVVFICQTVDGVSEVSLPRGLLNWLIALSLHLAGTIEAHANEELLALLPEGFELCALREGLVGLRMVLPGGAPLTFGFAQQDALLLAKNLVAHLQMIAPLPIARP